MLTSKDRWILAGAWGAILASGLGGVLWIQATKMEPGAFTAAPPAPDKPAVRTKGRDYLAETSGKFGASPRVRLPVTPYVGCITSEVIIVEGPEQPVTVKVPPTLLYSGKVEMDRATLAWTLKAPKLVQAKLRKEEASAPRAIVILRRCDIGEWEPVAVLDPKASSFEDREVQPNRSYLYSIRLRAEEGVITYKESHVRIEDKEGEGRVEGEVPSWHKVRLIGGDTEHAILGVETYNPGKARWEPKVLRASPGQPIGATGWTLDRMWFDRFTLKAAATDDRSVKRELSTRTE